MLYSVTDSESSLILAHPSFEDIITKVAQSANIEVKVFSDKEMDDIPEQALPDLFDMEISRRALIIFTSGTTGIHFISYFSTRMRTPSELTC